MIDQSTPKDRSEAGIARRWWTEIQGDSGARARLRRAADPFEALQEGAAIQLARALNRKPTAERVAPFLQVGALAALLAQLRNDRPGAIAARLGQGHERPSYSALRFRRLMSAERPNEILLQFRRTLYALDHEADVADLATSVLYWNERTKTRWVYAYYGAADAAPDNPNAPDNPHDKEETAA